MRGDGRRHEVAAVAELSSCGTNTFTPMATGISDSLRGTVERRCTRHGMEFQELRLLP